MPARNSTPGGDLELRVLATLWRMERATVPELHREVGEPAGLAYNTTGKVLERLHGKGLVVRERAGRTFRYRAAEGRERVLSSLARGFIRSFLGSEPLPAMASLVDAVEQLDPQLLEELSRLVAARRKARRGP